MAVVVLLSLIGLLVRVSVLRSCGSHHQPPILVGARAGSPGVGVLLLFPCTAGLNARPDTRKGLAHADADAPHSTAVVNSSATTATAAANVHALPAALLHLMLLLQLLLVRLLMKVLLLLLPAATVTANPSIAR